MKLQHWDSGREDMRNIPVVCGVCNQQVSVSGVVQDGQLIFDPCPNCTAIITGGLFVEIGEPEERERDLDIGVTVEWWIEGGVESQRSSSFGPIKNVPSLLMTILVSGVDYYAHPNLSKEYLYTSIACMITGNLLSQVGVEKVADVTKTLLEKFMEAGGPQIVGLKDGETPESEDTSEESEDDDE